MGESDVIDMLKDILQARVEQDAPKLPCNVYATEEDALLAGQEKAETLAKFAKATGELGPDYGDSLPYLVFESESVDGWVVAIGITEIWKKADGVPHYFMP